MVEHLVCVIPILNYFLTSEVLTTPHFKTKVMTADLAVACSGYVTSVVLANDMVARTCIHNIQVRTQTSTFYHPM